MSAQSWVVTVKVKNSDKTEQISVFAPNPDNARKKVENQGFEVINVREGHFFKNVNSSAEFKNL